MATENYTPLQEASRLFTLHQQTCRFCGQANPAQLCQSGLKLFDAYQQALTEPWPDFERDVLAIDTAAEELGAKASVRSVILRARELKKLWKTDEGQDIAEYAVMLAVILVIVVGTIRLIGSNANNIFSSVGSSLQ